MTPVEVRAGPAARPLWQRTRFWLALAGLLLVGGLVLVLVAPRPGRDLDPESAAKNGSKALAQVLRSYGVSVSRTSQLAVAAAVDGSTAVVVVAPDDYAPSQLATLVSGPARVVLLAPDPGALAVDPALQISSQTGAAPVPGCTAPGALAAGRVEFPASAMTYSSSAAGSIDCYDGALVIDGRLAVLGSADLLRNDALDGRGVAALDVNVLTADRTLDRVVWLLPGTDSAGPGAPTLWQLFPAGAHRAFVWAIAIGVVLVIWRARRLGPPVAEPLPVIVRAAEVVEGHGRLYRRAGARQRAANALRAGTAHRLARHVGLPRSAAPGDVAALVAATIGHDRTRVRFLLEGPAPDDDAALVELARALHELEAAAGLPPEEKGDE